MEIPREGELPKGTPLCYGKYINESKFDYCSGECKHRFECYNKRHENDGLAFVGNERTPGGIVDEQA